MWTNFFKSTPLAPYFERCAPVFWDVGARGGLDGTVAPFAWCTAAVGFEPDHAAFERLKPTGLWREERYLPVALSGASGENLLRITRDPAGSSFLEHDPEIGRRYHLPALFEEVATMPAASLTMADAAAAHGVPAPDVLKLDAEGAELDILKGAGDLLAGISAVKVEVSFMAHRIGQPLAPAVIEFLLAKGFCLMDIGGAARWRTRPWADDPYMVDADPAYSRGRLAQADLLFLRDRDRATATGVLTPAMIAIGLGYFDHGLEVAGAVEGGCDETADFDAAAFRRAVFQASKAFGRKRIGDEMRATAAAAGRLIKSYVLGLGTPPDDG